MSIADDARRHRIVERMLRDPGVIGVLNRFFPSFNPNTLRWDREREMATVFERALERAEAEEYSRMDAE